MSVAIWFNITLPLGGDGVQIVRNFGHVGTQRGEQFRAGRSGGGGNNPATDAKRPKLMIVFMIVMDAVCSVCSQVHASHAGAAAHIEPHALNAGREYTSTSLANSRKREMMAHSSASCRPVKSIRRRA